MIDPLEPYWSAWGYATDILTYTTDQAEGGGELKTASKIAESELGDGAGAAGGETDDQWLRVGVGERLTFGPAIQRQQQGQRRRRF